MKIFLLFVIIIFSTLNFRSHALISNTPDPQVQQLQALIESDRFQGPQLGMLYLQLALTLQQQWYSKQIGGIGLSEALEAYNEALKLMEQGREIRKIVEVCFHRGVLLKIMGRGDESIASYKLALKYELNNVDLASFYYNIGDSEMMMGNLANAVYYFEKSFALVPCKTDRYYGYVMALKELSASSSNPGSNSNSTIVSKSVGSASISKIVSKEGWTQLLNKLLGIEEKCQYFWDKYFGSNSNSRTKKLSSSNSAGTEITFSTSIATIEDEEELWDNDFFPSYLHSDGYLTLDAKTALFPTRKSDLFFAIYIAADKAKNYRTAWEYLVKGNTAEKNHRDNKFDAATAIHMKNSTTMVFNQDLIDMFPDISEKASNVPIFVIGMMRSGSTLIETMLDAHPLIWGMGEDSVFNGNLTFLRDSIVAATGSPKKLQEVVLDYGKSTVFGMKKMVKQALGDLQQHGGIKKKQNSNKGKDMKKMKHIVDKMLFNYRNIGFIHAVYPESLIIHMVRDPLDTIFSCYRQKFDDNGLEWSLDIKDLVLQYVLYLEYVDHFRKLLPDRVLDVRYEDLVDDPEEILRDIVVNRLSLPWDPKVLDFHNSQRVVLTNSQSQVRQKLYKHSMGGWRLYADHVQPIISEFRKFLPHLKKKRMLPFPDKINWNMDPDFPYDSDDKVAPGSKSSTNVDHRGGQSASFTVRRDL